MMTIVSLPAVDSIPLDELHQRFERGESLSAKEEARVRCETNTSYYYRMLEMRMHLIQARKEAHEKYRSQLYLRGDRSRLHKNLPLK